MIRTDGTGHVVHAAVLAVFAALLGQYFSW